MMFPILRIMMFPINNDVPNTSNNDNLHNTNSNNDVPNTLNNDVPNTSNNDVPNTSNNDVPNTSNNDNSNNDVHDASNNVHNSNVHNSSLTNVTPVKVKPIPEVVPFHVKSFYNIDFTATSTPMQPPKKRCRTRGGCAQIRNGYEGQLKEVKYKQINELKYKQINELKYKQINELKYKQVNKLNNNTPPAQPPHTQPQPMSPHTRQLNFSEDEFDDDIFLNDIVSSSIPPLSPQDPVGNVQDVPSAIPSSSSFPPQPLYVPNIPSYDNVDVSTWTNNSRPFQEFEFIGLPGVKVAPHDHICPLSILKTFLTDEVISNIVLYTNTYAALLKISPSFTEKVGGCNRTLLDLWKEVNADDIWIYIGILILMGIVSKPEIHMYWSTDSIISTPIFSRLMRRDRFEQIRSMIHFTDPINENPKDPLRKLSSFLEDLQKTFIQNYIPKQHVAVDEYLSPWKGRLGFRQYIPTKRERYGVKIYMLCESDTAYLWKFIIYTGAETIYPVPNIPLLKSFDDYKIPSKIVLSLMNGLYNQGYNVTLDNLYTSPELLRLLFHHQTDSYGTLRKKAGLPADFWQWKPIKEVGEQPLIQYCGELMVCRWSDCYKSTSKKSCLHDVDEAYWFVSRHRQNSFSVQSQYFQAGCYCSI